MSISPSGLNFHPSLIRYIGVAEIPDKWPFLFYDELRKTQVISTDNYENLEDLISNSKNDLTHIIVDDDPNLPKFLQEVFYNEEEFYYLQKKFDSKELDFHHHVKLFEIDFEKFNLKNQKNLFK